MTCNFDNSSGSLEFPKGFPLRFVTVPCPCCGSSDFTIAAEVKSHHAWLPGLYSYVECSACSVVYLNPRLDGDSLARCYSNLDGWSEPPPDQRKESGATVFRLLRRAWKYMTGDCDFERMVKIGPVLDVGSNEGALLTSLKARGIEAEGLEFNSNAVVRCRSKGLVVFQGDVANAVLSPDRYGTITMFHVLEHLDNPVFVIRKLLKALAPGGHIMIVVPHVKSPMRRLFGSSWQGWDAPFHLVHYDVRSIERLAQLAGGSLARYKICGSVEDVRRTVNIWRERESRGLLLRAVSSPAVQIAAWFGVGGVLAAWIRKPSDE